MTTLHALMACSISFSAGVTIATVFALRIIHQRDQAAQRIDAGIAAMNNDLRLTTTITHDSLRSVEAAFAGLDYRTAGDGEFDG